MLIFTVIIVDDGLLRTNTGCAGPSSSLTLYDDRVKEIVDTIENIQRIIHVYVYIISAIKN